MIGKYHLSVRNIDCDFSLSLNQKFTIIRGASGTGKSVFADLVGQFSLNKENSGVEILCEVPVLRLVSDDDGTWEDKLKTYKEAIFVVDEFDTCLYKREGSFAKQVMSSSAYFIIISRRALGSLAYGVDSIYEFVAKENKTGVSQVYTTVLQLSF